MTKTKTLLILATFALIIPGTMVYAFDLGSGFDEPCPTGMSILQEVCDAVNDLHDLLHIIESRVNSVNATQISEASEQDGIQVDITDLQTDIAILNAEIAILQQAFIVDEAINLEAEATTTGAINPQSNGILFYGDTLCEIEQFGHLVIVFGGNTTVEHQNLSCSPSNGNPIVLDTAQDELFQFGDVLALERISNEWVEVYRSQT